MRQDEINSSEWSNPDNWVRPIWLGLYFSRKDSRAWVPKHPPVLGWTVNFAQPRGAFLFFGIIGAALLAVWLVTRLAG